MAKYINGRSDRRSNGNNNQRVVQISPHHSQNKERNRWFDFLQMYTTNYIQEGDEETERFRNQQ